MSELRYTIEHWWWRLAHPSQWMASRRYERTAAKAPSPEHWAALKARVAMERTERGVVCGDCGALVYQRDWHREWHSEIDGGTQ